MSPRVTAFDLSCTSTGAARADGRLELIKRPLDTSSRHPEVLRRDLVGGDVASTVTNDRPDLVVIESLPTGRAFGLIPLAKLHAVVERELAADPQGPPILWVTPDQRAGWATGNGRSKKQEVTAAAIALGAPVPDRPKGGRDDLADAWLLQGIGLAHLGEWNVERTAHRVELVHKLAGVS